MTEPAARHAITLRHAVTIPRSPTRVFEFLTTEIGTHYCALARGHQRFEVIGGGPLVEGAVIDCRERAGNQEVHHRYVVRELLADRRIRYESRPATCMRSWKASRPSASFVHLDGRTIAGTSETFVSYELAPVGREATRVDMTIVIAFATRWQLFVARVLGRTARLWGAHQREELDGLSALIGASA